MLIKALCDYYDVKEKAVSSDDTSDFFSAQDVSYMIHLNINGEIISIVDIRDEKKIPLGKDKTKTIRVPKEIILPKRSQKTGIDVNIIEHRPLYIFGLNYDKETGVFTTYDKTQKAEKSHKVFVEGNLQFCEGIESEIVIAYRNFLLNWNPEEQTENAKLLSIAKEYSNSYYCFAFNGDERVVLNKDKTLLERYIEQKKDEHSNKSNEITAICPIEGKNLPVARIHEKITGIRGGNPVGSVLVGIKESAFESYGKTQAFNSGISELAMKKYTQTLNNFLSDPHHHVFLGELSLVFFAVDNRDEDACDLFEACISGRDDENLEKYLETAANEISQGRVADADSISVNDKLLFYVAGLTPNSSRISQKFVVRNSFGKIMTNIQLHQQDLRIKEELRQIPIWKLTKELVSPKAKDDVVPAPLLSSLFLSMLNGTNYPASLLDTVIRRVRTDHDDDKNPFVKINDIRVSIIKACLNRKARLMNKKEEIMMNLDLNNTNQAYLCGRLFAVLEYVQQRASAGKLNRTIKDAYFSSACARPATVFPKLVMLSQHHLSSMDSSVYFDKLIGSIMVSLNGEFPQTLPLDDQGKFIVGYYQQNNSLYTKNTEKQD